MSNYTGPKVRKARALNFITFENGKSKQKAFEKKRYKPGEHGQGSFSKMSEYKKQLQEKQKVRFTYGITEKQSLRYFKMASKKDGITGTQYLILLERRIDNVLYQAGLAMTRPQARQMVNHGLIKINGRRVKTPSILVKAGDTFEVRQKLKSSPLFEEIKKQKVKTPRWLKVDLKNLKGEVMNLPEKDDTPKGINSQAITEFYSK